MAKKDESIRKHSITIDGHATSVSLEDAFWAGLKHMALERGQSLATLISVIDGEQPGNLSSALRLAVLKFYRNK